MATDEQFPGQNREHAGGKVNDEGQPIHRNFNDVDKEDEARTDMDDDKRESDGINSDRPSESEASGGNGLDRLDPTGDEDGLSETSWDGTSEEDSDTRPSATGFGI